MKKAVILDTSAIMYRSHFALMGMRNSKGLANGADLWICKYTGRGIEGIFS